MTDIEEPATETPKKTSPTNGAIFRGILTYGIVIIGLFVFAYAGTPLQNTINGGTLWLGSFIVGIIFFIPFFILSKPKSLSLLSKLKSRKYTFILYLVGSILWIFNMTSFIDTTFANSQIESKDFTVIEKSISQGSGRLGFLTHIYFIHCNDNIGDNVVLQIDKPSWDSLKENGKVKLYLKKGFFGGEYVTSFQMPNQ